MANTAPDTLMPPVQPEPVRSDPVRNEGQWSKNLEYWKDDGSIVLRAESTLFKVHRSQFEHLSTALRGLLTIPPSTTGILEGTEKWPLYMPDTTEAMLTDVLSFLYHSAFNTPSTDPANEQKYLNILAFADRWEITPARKYAIYALEHLEPPLRAARRLELARIHTILLWVRPAVEDLMQLPLSFLDPPELMSFGGVILRRLLRAYEFRTLELERTAQLVPQLSKWDEQEYGCPKERHQRCIDAWDRVWWEQVGRPLLHPHRLLRPSGIVAHVEGLVRDPEISPICYADALQAVRNSDWAEGRVVAQVIEHIKEDIRGMSMKQYDENDL
uniref:BTB domain-containing protein n=1 Tax=Mycena chlorophos TaxID=658473 RepID=A0ABQ0KUZ7_MYCCL|nr:predicted protein [Mycena chlorophos]